MDLVHKKGKHQGLYEAYLEMEGIDRIKLEGIK